MDTNSLFAKAFFRILREDGDTLKAKAREELSESCRSTFRRDPLGNRVEVPYGGTYHVGKNGRGRGIRKGNTAKEDLTGKVHDLKPGEVLRTGSNGKGVAVCPTDSTSERKGQIVVNRKKPKVESRKPSCLQLLQRMQFLAEG